jgi:hypothetical protein
MTKPLDGDELGRLLATVDDHPPAGGPDVGALLPAGRARARRRRLGQAGLLAAAVGVIAGAAMFMATVPGHGDHRGRHHAPAPVATRPATVPPAPDQYDPMVRTFDLADVPAALSNPGYSLTTTYQQGYVEAGLAGSVTPVRLTVHARGWNPNQPTESEDIFCARGARTDPVHGRPAYLLTQPDRSGHSTASACEAGLLVEYAPDSWAEVQVPGHKQPGADSAAGRAARQRLARDVAVRAVYGLHVPQALPFQVTAIPAGTRLTRSDAAPGRQSGSDKAHGTLTFASAEGGSIILGCVVNDTTTHGKTGHANREVNGHPALDSVDELFVFKVSGCEITVEAQQTLAQRAALATTVRPVDKPAEPSHWTTHVLP